MQDVETSDDPGEAYEVEVRKDDGTEVDVTLDKDLKVVGQDSDDASDDRALSADRAHLGRDRRRWAPSAGGTVIQVEASDDGGAAYEVEVRDADNAEWDVDLDAAFAVVTEDPRPLIGAERGPIRWCAGGSRRRRRRCRSPAPATPGRDQPDLRRLAAGAVVADPPPLLPRVVAQPGVRVDHAGVADEAQHRQVVVGVGVRRAAAQVEPLLLRRAAWTATALAGPCSRSPTSRPV